MARYIKANPQVAKYLNLETDRNTVADGNYLLWQADMLVFGPLTELNNTLAMIGGIALMPHEAREEQDGTVIRPLPTPTDERFIYNPPVDDPQAEAEETTEQPEGETQAPNEETPAEGSGETEQQGDNQEPAAEEPTGEDQTEGSGELEQQPEAPANDAAGDQPEPEAETPTDQPEDENGESQEITAGDVGSVEDLVDFAPAEETE